MVTVMTKTQARAVNARLRSLQIERRRWLAARYVPWGWPWCDGPGSIHHQEIGCEGCGAVAWCQHRAEEIAAEIGQLEALLVPAVQGVLW